MSEAVVPSSSAQSVSAATDTRTLHGIVVDDPHRWLAAIDDPRVQQWVDTQDQAARDFLAHCPALPRAHEFLERNHVTPDPLWSAQRGELCFDLARAPRLSQPLLRVRDAAGSVRVLLDPNGSGRVLRTEQLSVSPSGRHATLLLSRPGEVLGTLHILDCSTGAVVETSDFATVMPVVAWHPAGTGFYYSLCRRLVEEHARLDGLYWHTLGTPWSADTCIKSYHDGPGHLAFARITSDGVWLLLHTLQFSSGSSGVSLHRLDTLPPENLPPENERAGAGVELFAELEGRNEYVGSAQGRLYFHTNVDAPNGRVVAIDPRHPARDTWHDVVPESGLALARPDHFGSPPKSAVCGDGLLVTYVEDAHDTLRHVTLKGQLVRRVDPPALSTVDGAFATPYGFRLHTQSFLEPRCTYDYRPSDGRLTSVGRSAMPDVMPAEYETRQVFYRASDGTKVPMYLLHRHGVQLDGARPTLLYGYGGFGQSITPEYSPEIALWLWLGGVYAVANIRGGGEYGERWHAAGSGVNKQTSFDDFYAAAEYLVAGGWTSPAHLVARGISNGGLLTAVCVNQRPDLFAAVVSELPLCDVLWLNDSPTGQAVTAEYGDPAASRETFAALRAYSPLQNIREGGRAPAQLVVVADRDMSARPPQVYRYVATRQQASRCAPDYAPVLLRVVRGEGHGDWPPETTRLALAEEIAFLHHFAVTGESAKLRLLHDLRVPMRDAAALRANAWLPATGEQFPAVLLRTPYGNDSQEFERLGVRAYAESGYAVVIESVRGRGDSDGSFGFFFVEGADGYDTVEWVAAQPWCNGKVAMDGGSYLGTVQWLAAREQPPHLKCILPSVPAGDWFNEIPYMGGALQVDWAFSWLGGMAGLSFDFDTSGDRNLDKYRPLIDAERTLGAELPLYREILEHCTLDDWWRRLHFEPQDFARIDLPVFTVTGWFDGDQAGSMRYWDGLEQHSPARAKARLVVGPWEHAQCYLGGERRVGEMDVGAASVLPIRRMRLAFLDEHMRDVPQTEGPRIRLFTTGDNRWHGVDRYPPPEVEHSKWYLVSAGGANTSAGDGRLDTVAALGPPDRFTFDPSDPVPYRQGARDHREIELRTDVLAYTSEPMSSNLTVLGPVEALIHVASDALDTDFTAKLLDVYPDGRAISLTHVGGVLRARYRNGFEQQQLLTPGRAEALRIRMSHVGHTFLAGHRVRLEISSSSFPMVDPNPNTGREIATETECRRAGQTVFHDAQHPSHLVLPVWRSGLQ